MARLFDDAQSEYLRTASFVAIAEPLTLACWYYADVVSAGMTLVSVGDTDGADFHGLLARGDFAGDPLWAVSYPGAGGAAAVTSTGFSINTWHHGCAVYAASNSRACYIDGGSKGTNVTDIAVVGADRAAVGVSADSSPWAYMSGRIAEAAIWDVALTDAEVAVLAAGYSPLFVRPQNLVAYWPLIRDEDQDRVGGYDLTAVNGPAIAAHPPVIYPASRAFVMSPAGAPPVAVALPIFATVGIHSIVFGGQVVR